MVLSDLFDDVDAMMAGLKHFRHRRHEVVLFHVLDPAELDFPFQQPTLFRGLEQAARGAGRAPRPAQGLSGRVQRFLLRLKRGCRMHRIDYVPVRTDQSLEVVLSSYLASRK